jgi:hypothetical protein
VTPPVTPPPPPPPANVCPTPGCEQYTASSGSCAQCQNCVNAGGYWTGSSCMQ